MAGGRYPPKERIAEVGDMQEGTDESHFAWYHSNSWMSRLLMGSSEFEKEFCCPVQICVSRGQHLALRGFMTPCILQRRIDYRTGLATVPCKTAFKTLIRSRSFVQHGTLYF
jgi:hypothetical protein